MKQNNPFNIRVNEHNAWLGKIPSTNGFEAFDTLEHGLRAGMKLLQNYNSKYNLNTIHDIIHKFAPLSENDTYSYIATVCQLTGLSSTQTIDLHDRQTMLKVAAAMIYVEQGKYINPIEETWHKYFA